MKDQSFENKLMLLNLCKERTAEVAEIFLDKCIFLEHFCYCNLPAPIAYEA
jgi:hypothetical protein